MNAAAQSIPRERKAVLLLAGLLFGAWVVLKWDRLTEDQAGIIRLVLGFLFAGLVLVRPKGEGAPLRLPRGSVGVLAMAGTLMVLVGLQFPIHQLEWLGLVVLLFACLRWALPESWGRDTLLALVLLYWVHPLPSQVFAPLQFWMQEMSTWFSEWLLHALNVRAWRHGLLLHAGYRVFGVPESCSGMKTAVTVLLSAIGAGALLRLRVVDVVLLTAAGLAQVLILNVFRICFIVKYGADMPPEWSYNILHATMGVFLIGSVTLVYLEAAIWRHWRQGRARQKRIDAEETPDRASRIPRVWQLILRWGWRVALAALVGLVALRAVQARRPAHRAEMIRGALDGLLATNLEAAEQAVNEALALLPGDPGLETVRMQVLFRREAFTEVIAAVGRIPDEQRSIEHRVLAAQSYANLGEMEQAMALVDGLPASSMQQPGVALIRAQFGVLRDQAEMVASNAVIAVRAHPLLERVRSLYPYLADHEQWAAIVEADRPLPYEEPVSALIACTAALEMSDYVRAQDILVEAVRKWPEDVHLIGPLHAMAVLQRGGDWEERYVRVLRLRLGELSADELNRQLKNCFRLARPDLAWQVVRRLEQVDPSHPGLLLAPAKYRDAWFLFRKLQLGVRSGDDNDVIDVRHLQPLAGRYEPWAAAWAAIPYGEVLSGAGAGAFSRARLAAARTEIERRLADGSASVRVKMMLPEVLAMAGDAAGAHASLDRLAAEHPERRSEILLEHAAYYEQAGEWENAYEALRTYLALFSKAQLSPNLRLANVLLRLDLGTYAMGRLSRAAALYPESEHVRSAIGAIWAYYGFPEESLFILWPLPGMQRTPVMAQLLYDTGRFKDAMRVASVAGISLPDAGADARQSRLLPPAEWTVRWMGGAGVTNVEEMMVEADRYRAELAKDDVRSPFVEGLRRLKLAWYETRGGAEESDPARWSAIGRDGFEKGAALNELTMLLARQGRFEEALPAAREAALQMPESPMLWRILLALSGGRREFVDAAVRACPADSELWLASLVVRLRDDGPGDWLRREVDAAVRGGRFSPGAMVRAGDLLLRSGRTEEASICARDAISRGMNLLAAYVLGLRCAMAAGDAKWVHACAAEATEVAVDPWPFYKLIVDLKLKEERLDGELVAALERLAERYPEEVRWRQRLGQVYFERGETDSALAVLKDAVEGEGSKVHIRTYLIAAEAARLEGRIERAVTILEAARRLHPTSVSVLNNLVYALAQDRRTLARAQTLLPELLAMGEGDNFAVLDTAAVVHLRAGNALQAEEFITRALSMVKKDDYARAEMDLNAAEIQLALGRVNVAKRSLELIRADAQRSALVDVRAREMLEQVRRQAPD